MSLRPYQETTLIECARDARAAESGGNNMWRNDLAQSIHVRPGDTINVEAAMIQSAVSDDQIELLGDKDNTGKLEFAYYLTNDWCFTAPLPLYDSLPESEVFWNETGIEFTSNAHRFSQYYGEVPFTPTGSLNMNTPGLVTPIEETVVNASKNLGPTYERFYLGGVYGGMYEPGDSWNLLTSETQFDVPKGFHTPAELAQLMTDTLHTIGDSCVKAHGATDFANAYVNAADRPLIPRYNPTDNVTKTYPTSTGEELVLKDKFNDWNVKTDEEKARLTFYSYMGCTEPQRMKALHILHSQITIDRSRYSTSADILPNPVGDRDLYTGFQYTDANGAIMAGMLADVGNFGLQIVVNDFLRSTAPENYGNEFGDCFPHTPGPIRNAANNHWHTEIYKGSVQELDLQDGDVIYTNLVATERNFKMLQDTLEQLKYPDEDGQYVADIDLGRADDGRCFSSRSTQKGQYPAGEERPAEIASFNLLSPPIAYSPGEAAIDANNNPYRAYTGLPVHYAHHYGVMDADVVNIARPMPSCVVLKKPTVANAPFDTASYYTSSEVDSEWGNRVSVYVDDAPDVVYPDTTQNESYCIQSTARQVSGPNNQVLGDEAGSSRGVIQDATWREAHQGQSPLGTAYRPKFDPNTLHAGNLGHSAEIKGLQNLLKPYNDKSITSWKWNYATHNPYATGIQVVFKQPQKVTQILLQIDNPNASTRPTSVTIYAAHKPFFWTGAHPNAGATTFGEPRSYDHPNELDIVAVQAPVWNATGNWWIDTTSMPTANMPQVPYKYYFIHLIEAAHHDSLMELTGLRMEADPIEVRDCWNTGVITTTTGCMQPEDSNGQTYTDYPIPKNMVVGYRSRQVAQFDVHAVPPNQPVYEPAEVRDIPFIGLIYKKQRVYSIPTPTFGEMLGVSRSFSDLKCAKVISSQKDGGADITPEGQRIYNLSGEDYVPTVNVGAANAQFKYNETLNRITLESLHTQLRVGQTEHNFSDNHTGAAANADGSLGLPGAPDLVQRTHFATPVCRDSHVDVFNPKAGIPRGRTGAWALMSAQTGVGIVGISNANGVVNHSSPSNEWTNCLWAKMGYELEDLLPVFTNAQLLYNSNLYRKSVLQNSLYQKYINQCSPLTTNGQVSTDQMVSLVTNQSGLPLFLAPGSLRDLGPSSLDQLADYIIPQNAPARFTYSHLVIYSDIIPHGSYIGCNKNTTIPAVGYATKSYVTGNYIYGQESPLVFTVERPYQISDILVDIRLPDGRPANLQPYSTVIFRVIKNKVAMDMIPQDLNKIKRRKHN